MALATVNRWVLYLAVAETGVPSMYMHERDSAKYRALRFALGEANSHASACWSGFENGDGDLIAYPNVQCTLYIVEVESAERSR